MSIAAKLAAASRAIGHIGKTKTEGLKYQYQSWDQIVPEARDAMAEVGLWMLPSMTVRTHEDVMVKTEFNGKVSERRESRVVVDVEIKIVNADSDESITLYTSGEARGNDDKTVQKAYTSAVKYAVLKALWIPINEPDPDETPSDSEAPKEAKAKRQAEGPTNGKAKQAENIETIRKFWTDLLGEAAPEMLTPMKQKGWSTGPAALKLIERHPNGGIKPPTTPEELEALLESVLGPLEKVS